MSLLLPVSSKPFAPSAVPQAAEQAAPDRASTLIGWIALAAVLVIGVPIFLCMPLNFDTFHYDICARNLLRGGVHYRDAFDNNLPGIVWLQAGIRALVGWRSESLHAVDLTFFSFGVVLLLNWVPAGARVWTAAALFAYYLFLPESCICQRDVWMLFPCLVGLTVRAAQVRRLLRPSPSLLAVGLAAVLEGLVWGAAVWIKPFVFAPGLACWLVSVLQVRRARAGGAGLLIGDALGLLAGGLIVCAVGLAGLWWSGSWPYFLEIFLGWNRDYAALTYRIDIRINSLASVMILYLPWSIAPIVAAYVAVGALRRELANRPPTADAGPARPGVALLAAFLVGWLFQALVLQFPHDYSLVPAIIPSVALLGGRVRWPRLGPVGSLLRMAAVAGMAFLWTLAFQLARVAEWPRCFREGASPALKSRLVMRKESAYAVDSAALADVEAFLVRQGAGDGEVTCLSGCTHPLYLDLNLKPSTRFSQVEMTALFFTKHRGLILAELNASRQRFIVSDLEWTGLTSKEAAETDPDDPLALPSDIPDKFNLMYPWYEPVVFRSGRYLVHRVTGPATHFWREGTVGVPDWENDYAEEFSGRQSFRDVAAAEATAAALEALYQRSEAAGDPAGRHEALRRGLTLLDQARAAGKDAEADVLRRWLEQKLDGPAAAGP